MSLQPPAVQHDNDAGPGRLSRRASIRQSIKRISSFWKTRKSNTGDNALAEAVESPAAVSPTATPALAKDEGEPTPAATPAVAKQAEEPTPAIESSTAARPSDLSGSSTLSVAEGKKPIPTTSAVLYIRGVDRRKRATDLFTQYNLNVNLGDFYSKPLDSDARRTEKSIKMRVRHNCHLCSMEFNVNRVCPSCGHNRCSECPREPTFRRRLPRTIERVNTMAVEGTASQSKSPDARNRLGRVAEGSVPFVLRTWTDPAQYQTRILRTCHRCRTDFPNGSATVCGVCSHRLCPRCPRESRPGVDKPPTPPPEGQERVYRKPKQRVKWTCHGCQSLFKDGLKECKTCGHRKCDQCARYPPKRPRNRATDNSTGLEGQFAQMEVGESSRGPAEDRS